MENTVPRGPALHAQVLRRDRTALADAYDAFGPAVWLAARGQGAERGAHEATRAVFVELWREPGQYDGRGSLGAALVARAETHAGPAKAPDADGTRRALAALPDEACLAITMAQRGSTCAEIAVALQTDVVSVQRWMREGLSRVAADLASTLRPDSAVGPGL